MDGNGAKTDCQPSSHESQGRADGAKRRSVEFPLTLWGDGASRSHIMFGDISAWFHQSLAGLNLDPVRPAFEHIVIRPRPVRDLKWVKADGDRGNEENGRVGNPVLRRPSLSAVYSIRSAPQSATASWGIEQNRFTLSTRAFLLTPPPSSRMS